MPTSHKEKRDRTVSPELSTQNKPQISAPANKTEPSHDRTLARESTALAQFRYRILVVDDERPVRELARRTLERLGYEVLTAADGLDGLHALGKSLPDLVISDLNMPRMSGYEFLAVVRERFPHIATIAVSGEDIANRNRTGIMADAILQKRFPLDELCTEILRRLTASPIRSERKKREISPLFVPRDKEGFLIITCTNCLRPNRLQATGMNGGLHETLCQSCGMPLKFEIIHEGEPLTKGDVVSP